MPVKQGPGIGKSGRDFGQRQRNAKMVRAGLYARVSTQDFDVEAGLMDISFRTWPSPADSKNRKSSLRSAPRDDESMHFLLPAR